ncbi:MAG: patatin-like phospholipase family protein [Anaerolineales bacterium]|nr:patatin-like phospholipase family protein [Anaerolineales bacterium]
MVKLEWLGDESQRHDWVTLLQNTFSALSSLETADVLFRQMSPLAVAGGEKLFTAGTVDEACYFVANGRLKMIDPAQYAKLGKPATVRLGRGDVTGLEAFLGQTTQRYEVTAVRDSVVLRLSRDAFDTFARAYPTVAIQFLAALAHHHIQALSTPPTPNPAGLSIALLPLHTTVNIDKIGTAVWTALEQHKPALYLNRTGFNKIFQKEDTADLPARAPRNLELVNWLQVKERKYTYFVYEAEPNWSEWTQRCLRQADVILLIADATASPIPSPMEEQLAAFARGARQELVLVHPAQTKQPSGTVKWLEPRHGRVQAHHHTRHGHLPDYERLVRRLTGQSIALVLGGGGARGIAYLGVFHALQEANIPIDFVAGTSMGAIMGATLALEIPDDTLLKVAHVLSQWSRVFDFTLPVVSLLESNTLTDKIREVYGTADLEDAWRPFFCMSSNLTRAAQECHQTGPVWQAIRASSALPGLFSPVVNAQGELLVDGGVLNNLPIDTMQKLHNPHRLIAVNVFAANKLADRYNLDTSVSGWDVLRNKLDPRQESSPVPLLFQYLWRTIVLNDVHQARRKLKWADLYIEPPVEKFHMLAFSSYEELIEMGYKAAQDALKDWNTLKIKAQ